MRWSAGRMDGTIGEAFLTRGELLEALPAAAYVVDREGVVRQYNARAAQLWGREPARGDSSVKFCGSHELFLLDGTPLPHERTPVGDVLRDGREVTGAEVVVGRPDGTRIIVSANITPIEDKAGNVVGAINCFYDVTDRKRAEEARHRSDARLALVADNLPALIGYVDGDERFEFVNRASESWFRRSREQLTGTLLRDAMGATAYQQRLPYLKAALAGQTVRFEGPHAQSDDASERNYEITYVPDVVADEGGGGGGGGGGRVRGIFVMAQDITDRKRFERALTKSEE